MQNCILEARASLSESDERLYVQLANIYTDKARKFNRRQLEYRLNRIKGMNQYNAARAAGYSENYARDHSDRVEKAVKVGIGDIFEQAGLTDKFLAEYLMQALNATRLYSRDFVEVADWIARHKFLETILRLKGHLP